MYTSLVAKVDKLNEAFGLSLTVEKRRTTDNTVDNLKPTRDGSIGRIYNAPNCAIASVWIDGYAHAWAAAHGG